MSKKEHEPSDREKQLDILRNSAKEPKEIPASDVSPSDHVGNAERGLRVAEAALAADPHNQCCKDEVDLRKRNLEKAKRV